MKKMENAKITVRIIVSLLVIVTFMSMAIAQPLPVTVCSTTGVMDENGVPLLGDGSSSSDLVQLINAGSDGTINPPDENGNPTGDDLLICDIRIGEGYPFNPDEGKFSHNLDLEAGAVIYCRAWNDATVTTATRYGDSNTITVTEAGDYDFGTWSTVAEKSTPSPTASPSPSPTPASSSTPTASPSPALTETPTSGKAKQTPSPSPSLSPSPSSALTPVASPTPISSPAPAPAEPPTPSLLTPAPTATKTPAVTPVDAKVLISSLAISIVIALRKRKRYKNKA